MDTQPETAPDPFKAAAADLRQRGSKATADRIEMEGKVARKLIDHALKSGYLISVSDGEEWVVKLSTDRKAILAAMFSTDGDNLMIRDPSKPGTDGRFLKVGCVNLLYGNSGYDVISDYSSADLDAFTAWLKPVDEYADKLELQADEAAETEGDTSDEEDA